MFRAVVEAERRSGGTTFRHRFWSQNGVPATILQHRSAFRSLKVERVPPPLENVLSRIRFQKKISTFGKFSKPLLSKMSCPGQGFRKIYDFWKIFRATEGGCVPPPLENVLSRTRF